MSGEGGQPAHAFLYSLGTFTTIQIPGSISDEAFGINDVGQIVGSSNLPVGNNGFLFIGGRLTTLPVPAGGAFVQAFSINDKGQIVGNFVDAKGKSQGYVLTGETFVTLQVPESETPHPKVSMIRAILWEAFGMPPGQFMGFSTLRESTRRSMSPAAFSPKPSASIIQARL